MSTTDVTEEGITVRQRLLMFAAVLIIVFVLVLVIGFML